MILVPVKQINNLTIYKRKRGSEVPFEIRVMVYEDGFCIKPKWQKPPYQHAAKRLADWWAKQRREKTA